MTTKQENRLIFMAVLLIIAIVYILGFNVSTGGRLLSGAYPVQFISPNISPTPVAHVLDAHDQAPDEAPQFTDLIPRLMDAYVDTDGQGDSGGGTTGGTTGGSGTSGPVTLADPPGLDPNDTVVIDGFTYYRMPESPSGLYDFYSCQARRYAQRDLIQVLHAVAQTYRQKTGGADSLYIGDINAAGHASHRWGVAVDIVTTGMGSMTYSDGYNATFAKYLGEAFVETGKIKNIWYCDDDVVNHVKAYARDRNLPLEQMYCINGHSDHFHVDINSPRGPDYTPGC